MPIKRAANCQLFIDISVNISLILLFLYLETAAPFQRVILDEELQQLRYPRRDSYVPEQVLWVIVYATPCVLVLLAWGVCRDANDALEILLSWSLAIGLTGVLTDSLKIMIGRPRPDFYYRCYPDGVGAAAGAEGAAAGVEGAALACSGAERDVLEGRKSFPSGHSSLSFCSLTTAAAWLCGRLAPLARARGSSLRLCACAAPLAAAAAVAASRLADYHHHWQDVVVGSMLGFAIAHACYRQHYHPLTSELAGVPYTAVQKTSTVDRETNMESSPLLAQKQDKFKI